MLHSVIAFVTADKALLAAFAVASLDLLFALNPKIQANGLLHAVYVFASGQKGSTLSK